MLRCKPWCLQQPIYISRRKLENLSKTICCELENLIPNLDRNAWAPLLGLGCDLSGQRNLESTHRARTSEVGALQSWELVIRSNEKWLVLSYS